MTRGFIHDWLALAGLTILVLLGSGGTAGAATSDSVIGFQGAVAVKPGQAALDANPYNARFGLWSAAGGGTLLWTESRTITIIDGLYHVELGEITPLPTDIFSANADLWLQVEINLVRHPGDFVAGDLFSPRQHLAMAPYADVANAAFVAGSAGELSQLNSVGSPVVESFVVGTDDGEILVRNDSHAITGEMTTIDDEGVSALSDTTGQVRASLSSLLGQGDLYFVNSADTIVATLTSNDEGQLQLNNTVGDPRVYLSSLANNGYLNLVDSTGASAIILDAVDGSISATGTKNFNIPYPGDPTRRLVYACPEGPEAAIYVRGTAKLVDGEASIDLPEHFALIAVAEGMTVQLTPRSADSYGLAAVAVTPARLRVKELMRGNGSYPFDYSVMAVRKGYEHYEAVRPTQAAQTLGAGRSPATVQAGREKARRQALARLQAAESPAGAPAGATRAGAAGLTARLGGVQR
ncbi:MAG: hypothetical protein M1457_10575 [bacterium]|nr:hypothetical protein [bacterium]